MKAEGTNHVEQIAQDLLARRSRPDGRILIRPGVYALFVDEPEAFSALAVDKCGLLYIGMTADDTGARNHFDPPTRHSGFSSPRRSIGALLKQELQLHACRRADGRSPTNWRNFRFSDEGEEALTTWMKNRLRMNLVPIPTGDRAKIEQVEQWLIANLKPPLNLKGWRNPQARTLRNLRKICRDEARHGVYDSLNSPGPHPSDVNPRTRRGNRG
jgi:hypothetical protein